MFKLSFRLLLSPRKQILLGSHKSLEIVNTTCRSFATMSEKWPVLEKRKVEEDTNDTSTKKQRIKKKMYAICLAYCGQGYSGLQRNNGLKTIEEELLKALKEIDVINDEEFCKQQLVNFQRAARTDKGVSAIRQVVNLSMRDGVKPEDLNQHLPEQIRVLAIKRVTKGFNSKNTCDSRTYSYTCPTFAFAPKDIPLSEDYRMDDEAFKNLSEYSQMYLGTHNFFSFTSGRKPFDPSCKRHIMDVKWMKPVVSDGIELIIFVVRGQSFMLHQIRKMVGTLMAVCRGYVGPNYIRKALNPNKTVYLPTAPGVGLLLEQVHYEWYNRKYGENGFHEKLDFADVEKEVEDFRRDYIFPMLIKAEKEEKSMMLYLETLDMHYKEDHSIRPEEDTDLVNETSLESNHTKSEAISESSTLPDDKLSLESNLAKSEPISESSTMPDDKLSQDCHHTKSESVNESSSVSEGKTISVSSS